MAKFNNVTVGQMEACINRMGGVQQFLDFIGGKGQIVWGDRDAASPTSYQFLVDYTLSLQQLIASGNYRSVGEEVNEKNFPKACEGKAYLNAELMYFKGGVSFDYILAEMKKIDCRPATLWEIATFGAKYPELQRTLQIVTIGSYLTMFMGNIILVPSLHKDSDGGPGLFMNDYGYVGGSHCRFLAIRNN